MAVWLSRKSGRLCRLSGDSKGGMIAEESLIFYPRAVAEGGGVCRGLSLEREHAVDGFRNACQAHAH